MAKLAVDTIDVHRRSGRIGYENACEQLHFSHRLPAKTVLQSPTDRSAVQPHSVVLNYTGCATDEAANTLITVLTTAFVLSVERFQSAFNRLEN